MNDAIAVMGVAARPRENVSATRRRQCPGKRPSRKSQAWHPTVPICQYQTAPPDATTRAPCGHQMCVHSARSLRPSEPDWSAASPSATPLRLFHCENARRFSLLEMVRAKVPLCDKHYPMNTAKPETTTFQTRATNDLFSTPSLV